jgi:FkbM family methyltransferase
MDMNIRNQQGLAKRLKRSMPSPAFRLATRLFNLMTASMPFRLKYLISGRLSAKRAPYSLLKVDDHVVQIGSARDILKSGRSRAVLFSKRVPEGSVLVIEADPENCAALRALVRKHGLSNVQVCEMGVWNSAGHLEFLSSAKHPAANLLTDAKNVSSAVKVERGYSTNSVQVDTLDNILGREQFPPPTLVSITTNGAEIPILNGMTASLDKCRFVSLASTGPDLVEHMTSLGFSCIARDDRGYCFTRD